MIHARLPRATKPFADDKREDAITARAAEILADNNALTNAAAEDTAVERALCDVVRIAMDRTKWKVGARLERIPPPTFLIATTALRAALYAYAERELDKEDRE